MTTTVWWVVALVVAAAAAAVWGRRQREERSSAASVAGLVPPAVLTTQLFAAFCEARDVSMAACVSKKWALASEESWRWLGPRDFGRVCGDKVGYSYIACGWTTHALARSGETTVCVGRTIYDLSKAPNCPCAKLVLDLYQSRVVAVADFLAVKHSDEAERAMASAVVDSAPRTGALRAVVRDLQSRKLRYDLDSHAFVDTTDHLALRFCL